MFIFPYSVCKSAYNLQLSMKKKMAEHALSTLIAETFYQKNEVNSQNQTKIIDNNCNLWVL